MMSPHLKREHDATVRHLSALVGKTVVAVAVDDHAETIACYGRPLVGLLFTDGITAYPMRDPEGNDAGHLDIMTPTRSEIRL